jgi:hypothetical protein
MTTETAKSAIEMAGNRSLPAPTARNELRIAMRTFDFTD